MIKITPEWDDALSKEFGSQSYFELRKFLKEEYSARTIYPSMYDIFNALKLTPLKDVKAVILGQDPYHEPGQAMGLAFSVPRGVTVPPSLCNIFKELNSETGMQIPASGDLTGWAKQGVLLLNTVLTVRAHAANSHKGKGWEQFTDGVIKRISDGEDGVVFMLWGGNARSKKPLIDSDKHLVLECPHPSPLSAYNGFFGCGHFVKANKFLTERGKTPIDWSKL